jgi:hypothetical protein
MTTVREYRAVLLRSVDGLNDVMILYHGNILSLDDFISPGCDVVLIMERSILPPPQIKRIHESDLELPSTYSSESEETMTELYDYFLPDYT